MELHPPPADALPHFTRLQLKNVNIAPRPHHVGGQYGAPRQGCHMHTMRKTCAPSRPPTVSNAAGLAQYGVHKPAPFSPAVEATTRPTMSP